MPNEPIERLSAFSPSAEGLDRDALLFEAGRASAPPDRSGWAVAGLLALTQAVTLLMWSPPPPPAPPLPAARQTPDSPLETRLPKDEPPADDLVPDAPPLRPMDRYTFTTLD